mgnify:CR=1 FL=1
MVDRAPINGLRVLRHWRRSGHYRDGWLYPGQLRLAVPVCRDGRLVAIVGAAVLAAACDRRREAALLAGLEAAAAHLAAGLSAAGRRSSR